MTDINYNDLVIEVVDEYRAGLEIHEAIIVVARDYGADTKVLKNSVDVAYPNGIKKNDNLDAKIQKAILNARMDYGVSSSNLKEVILKDGKKITAICFDGSDVVGVSHANASTRLYKIKRFVADSLNNFE